MNAVADRAKQLFLEIIREPARQRPECLDRACGGDSQLRERVEALLRAHEDPTSFLKDSATDNTDAVGPALETVGTTIGRYKLLQQIGEGGFGTVYLAEQKEPVERRVALKIIKPGMDSRQVIARFEAERQALAMMDHPNIAKVLDAGTTEGGRPYFVMELVKGVPITRYCDEKRLSLKERLELMIAVCQAIQHAHQKGIIHRDIKPTNVLVAQYDGQPVPKVIDFGVAKATGQKLTERTMFTELGQIVGTLEYMSPEQAELNQLDIDTRSDIYSLGVLLYELLTGSTPFDKQTLRTVAFQEMLRIIREEEPLKPSTKLSTIDTLASIAANRSVEPTRLGQSIRGELDWIVMKALEKDRNRRYDSAIGLAGDIQRYLRDEPIGACPPSIRYRFGKFARKHRAALTTATILAMSLLLGSAISIWQAIRATMAEARATSNETRAIEEGKKAILASKSEAQERQRAEEGERQAQANLKRAREAVDQMLVRVAARLSETPHMEQLRRELLSEALKHYDGFLQEGSTNPEVQFETGLALLQYGDMQSMLGELRQAEDAFKRAIATFGPLAESDPANGEYRMQFAHSHNRLGNLLSQRGLPTEAIEEYRRALELTRQLVTQFPDNNGYPQWEAGRLSNIGRSLAHLGRLAEAESTLHESLAIRQSFPGQGPLRESYVNLTFVLSKAGRYEEAEQRMAQAIAIDEKELANSPRNRPVRDRLAGHYNDQAELLRKLGRAFDAEKQYRTAITMAENLVADFPSVPAHRSSLAAFSNNLANFYNESGRYEESQTLYRDSVAMIGKLASDFPDTPEYRMRLGQFQHNLANVLANTDQPRAACDQYRQALTTFTGLAQQFREDADFKYLIGSTTSTLADALLELGKVEEATALLQQAIPDLEQLAANHPNVADFRDAVWMAYVNLGIAKYRAADWGAAKECLERGLNQAKPSSNVLLFVAMVEWRLGNSIQARALYDQAVQVLEKDKAPTPSLRRLRDEATLLLELQQTKASPAAEHRPSGHSEDPKHRIEESQ